MTSQDDLTKHREAVHEGIKYACGLCGKGFISQSNLAEHRRAVHEGIKFPCGQCGKKYTSQDDFAKHRGQFTKESNILADNVVKNTPVRMILQTQNGSS